MDRRPAFGYISTSINGGWIQAIRLTKLRMINASSHQKLAAESRRETRRRITRTEDKMINTKLQLNSIADRLLYCILFTSGLMY